MKKFAGYILTPFAIVWALFIMVIFQPIQWVTYKLFGINAHKVVADLIPLGFIISCCIMFNRVVFINKQKLPKGRPIIFLSNHQSHFDITPLAWFLRRYHAKFISKIELTRGILSISYFLRTAGGANIDRDNPRQSLSEIAALGVRMKEKKWSAFIFPEGTRSSDGKVKPFQAAGVTMLLKKCPEALLVPVAINNTWKFTRWGIYPLGAFGKISLEVLSPIEPGNTPVDVLVKQAEDRIRERVFA